MLPISNQTSLAFTFSFWRAGTAKYQHKWWIYFATILINFLLSHTSPPPSWQFCQISLNPETTCHSAVALNQLKFQKDLDDGSRLKSPLQIYESFNAPTQKNYMSERTHVHRTCKRHFWNCSKKQMVSLRIKCIVIYATNIFLSLITQSWKWIICNDALIFRNIGKNFDVTYHILNFPFSWFLHFPCFFVCEILTFCCCWKLIKRSVKQLASSLSGCQLQKQIGSIKSLFWN